MPEPEVLPGQVWKLWGETWIIGAVRWDGYEHTAYCHKRRGSDTLRMPASSIARNGILKPAMAGQTKAAVPV